MATQIHSTITTSDMIFTCRQNKIKLLREITSNLLKDKESDNITDDTSDPDYIPSESEDNITDYKFKQGSFSRKRKSKAGFSSCATNKKKKINIILSNSKKLSEPIITKYPIIPVENEEELDLNWSDDTESVDQEYNTNSDEDDDTPIPETPNAFYCSPDMFERSNPIIKRESSVNETANNFVADLFNSNENLFSKKLFSVFFDNKI